MAAEDLKLWVVTRGKNGSIGLTYLAPAAPEAALRAGFTAAAAAERVQGRDPELDDIALLRCPDELAALAGPHADHRPPLLRVRLSQTSARKSRPRSSSSATQRRPRARKRAKSLRIRETALRVGTERTPR
ncbi:hypothetical protein ACJ7VE_33695 [Streptomyces sp. PB17]|uniref:hypothetical protein n=1 Tax=Streptomyces sp. PB17 TaxID=3384158 RepID=UPI0038B428E3